MTAELPSDVWSFCILPYCGILEYASCFEVSKHMQQLTRTSIRHRKELCLVHDSKFDRRMLNLFARYSRSLRVLDVRLSANVCPDAICALLRQSHRLEAFMSSSAHDAVLDDLVVHCPDLIALALCTGRFSIAKLMSFHNLKALEIGCASQPMTYHVETLARVFHNHPTIEIVHILSFRNSLKVIENLNPLTVRSIACPYEREVITTARIIPLQKFTRLENLNFGESMIEESAISQVSYSCHNLRKFSLSPKENVAAAIKLFNNDPGFKRLEYLGCRTPRSAANIPVIHSAFTDTGARRDWQIVDYAIDGATRLRDHWCREPFEFVTLLNEYDLLSRFG